MQIIDFVGDPGARCPRFPHQPHPLPWWEGLEGGSVLYHSLFKWDHSIWAEVDIAYGSTPSTELKDADFTHVVFD